jgi:hypothetical protein
MQSTGKMLGVGCQKCPRSFVRFLREWKNVGRSSKYGCVMPTSDHYRRKAEECRAQAAKTTDPKERESLLRICAQWDQLSKHKATLEARRHPLRESRA